MSDVISDYLGRLSTELRFDPVLSRRVQEEVEDHLREAVADAVGLPDDEAARLAVERFGNPHEIAVQFAAVSLERKVRRVWPALVGAIAAVFIAMKIRGMWFDIASYVVAGSGADQTVRAVLASIDHCGFIAALVLGPLGWIYARGLPIPWSFGPRDRARQQQAFTLCAAATTVLLVSTVAEAALTGLHFLQGGGAATRALIPVLVPLIAASSEVVLAIGLAGYVHHLRRRAALTWSQPGG